MAYQEVINFQREEYRHLCEELKDILTKEKELAFKKDEIKQEIINLAGGDRMEYGIKVTHRTSSGSIDYKAIVESKFTPQEIKELGIFFRKEDRKYWEVRNY